METQKSNIRSIMMVLFVSTKNSARTGNKLLQNAYTILILTSTPVCHFQAKKLKAIEKVCQYFFTLRYTLGLNRF